MNGRTYCGKYKGYYLKSTLEYVYARYLDHMGINWKYEIKTFDLSSGGSYKPDFFLVDSSEFVEVKGGFNLATDLPRIKQFELDYSQSVKVIQEKEIRSLLKSTPYTFNELKTEWKQIAQGLGMDLSGENNPRFGVRLSSQTKSKISERAKQRFQDPNFKAKMKAALAKAVRKPFNPNPPQRVALTCLFCGNSFEDIPCRASKRMYCSYNCLARNEFSKRHNGQDEIVRHLALAFSQQNSESILNCKLNKIKPVLEGFYLEVLEATTIKDVRTISFILLGRYGSRKEVLRYFQDLVENVFGTAAKDEAAELKDKEPLG